MVIVKMTEAVITNIFQPDDSEYSYVTVNDVDNDFAFSVETRSEAGKILNPGMRVFDFVGEFSLRKGYVIDEDKKRKNTQKWELVKVLELKAPNGK